MLVVLPCGVVGVSGGGSSVVAGSGERCALVALHAHMNTCTHIWEGIAVVVGGGDVVVGMVVQWWWGGSVWDWCARGSECGDGQYDTRMHAHTHTHTHTHMGGVLL